MSVSLGGCGGDRGPWSAPQPGFPGQCSACSVLVLENAAALGDHVNVEGCPTPEASGTL